MLKFIAWRFKKMGNFVVQNQRNKGFEQISIEEKPTFFIALIVLFQGCL